MPDLDPFLPPLLGLLAYGPAPGVELLPYFLGLLAWAGLAVASIFLSPITALLRRLRRAWVGNPAESDSEPTTPAGEGAAGEGQSKD